MPLIANAPRIEYVRIFLPCCMSRCTRSRRDEPCLSIGVPETTIFEKSRRTRFWTRRSRIQLPCQRPLDGLEVVVICKTQACQATDVEAARTVVLRTGETRMLVKYLVHGIVVEARREAHPFGYFRDDPPVRPDICGQRKERTLA